MGLDRIDGSVGCDMILIVKVTGLKSGSVCLFEKVLVEVPVIPMTFFCYPSDSFTKHLDFEREKNAMKPGESSLRPLKIIVKKIVIVIKE